MYSVSLSPESQLEDGSNNFNSFTETWWPDHATAKNHPGHVHSSLASSLQKPSAFHCHAYHGILCQAGC